jgi:hypothetical protein
LFAGADTLSESFVATYVAGQCSKPAGSCDVERFFGTVGREVDGRESLTDKHINDKVLCIGGRDVRVLISASAGNGDRLCSIAYG